MQRDKRFKTLYNPALDDGGGATPGDTTRERGDVMHPETQQFAEYPYHDSHEPPQYPFSVLRMNSQPHNTYLVPSDAHIQGNLAESSEPAYPYFHSHPSSWNRPDMYSRTPHDLNATLPSVPNPLQVNRRNLYQHDHQRSSFSQESPANSDHPASLNSFASNLCTQFNYPEQIRDFYLPPYNRHNTGYINIPPREDWIEDRGGMTPSVSVSEESSVFNIHPTQICVFPNVSYDPKPSTGFGQSASYQGNIWREQTAMSGMPCPADGLPPNPEEQHLHHLRLQPTQQVISQQALLNQNNFYNGVISPSFQPVGVGTWPQHDLEQRPMHSIGGDGLNVSLPSTHFSPYHHVTPSPRSALPTHVYPSGPDSSAECVPPCSTPSGSTYLAPATTGYAGQTGGTLPRAFSLSPPSPTPFKARGSAKSSRKRSLLGDPNLYLSSYLGSTSPKGLHKQRRARLLAFEDIPSNLQPWHQTQGRNDFIPDYEYESCLIREGKSFVCIKCRHSLSRPGLMYEHISRHLGHKPYLCLDCGKRFTRKVDHSDSHNLRLASPTK